MYNIELTKLKVLPAFLMAIYVMYSSLSFAAVDMLGMSYLLLALLLLSSCFSIFLMIRKRFLSRYDLLVVAFLLFVFAVSLTTNLEVKKWVYTTFAVILLIFLCNYYQDNITYLLIGALIGFSLSIYIGFVQIASHPEMWMVDDFKDNRGYILGDNYNQIGNKVLCALLTNALCLKISKWFWINMIPLLIAGLGMLFMVYSMTSVTSIILFIVLCVFPNVKLQRLLLCCILVGAFLFEIFVCFNGKGLENNELASWFIVDVLGKDITFTNRTEMWDSALRIIIESPIWGYGFPTEEWYIKNMSSYAVGPHNAILAMLIYGGVIALGLYLSVLYMALKGPFLTKDRMSNIVIAAIVVLTVMMLMEIYSIEIIFYLFTLAYYYDCYRKNVLKKEGYNER
jgi:O-antigen ligase